MDEGLDLVGGLGGTWATLEGESFVLKSPLFSINLSVAFSLRIVRVSVGTPMFILRVVKPAPRLRRSEGCIFRSRIMGVVSLWNSVDFWKWLCAASR